MLTLFFISPILSLLIFNTYSYRGSMASIQERKKNGKPSYTAKIRLKGHQPVFQTFTRKTDAVRWANQTETAIIEGRFFKTAESQKHTLSDLIQRYIRDVLPRKAKVYVEYASQLKWWEEQIGDVRLSDLSTSLISEKRDLLSRTITNRKKKMSNARVNRYMAALSTALNTSIREWEWMEDNPMRKISKLKEPRGRVRYLSDEERERLLDACKDSANTNLYLVVVLALNTGARQQEIWDLRWSNINLIKGLITFSETKNNEFRSVPLKGHPLKLLLEHSRIRREDSDIVFPSKKNPSVSYDFRNPWKKALLVAEVEDFRWHDLRHSCASYLAMNGQPIRTIAEILGHKTLSMVQRYTHLNAEHLSEAISDLDKKMFGSRS
jgi:integrase